MVLATFCCAAVSNGCSSTAGSRQSSGLSDELGEPSTRNGTPGGLQCCSCSSSSGSSCCNSSSSSCNSSSGSRVVVVVIVVEVLVVAW